LDLGADLVSIGYSIGNVAITNQQQHRFDFFGEQQRRQQSAVAGAIFGVAATVVVGVIWLGCIGS